MRADIRLAEQAFAPEADIARFRAAHGDAGGVVSFVGQVRAGNDVEALELTHYAPLTLPGMQALAASTATRWALAGLLMVHRVGVLAPGEPIVLVAAAARHRVSYWDAAIIEAARLLRCSVVLSEDLSPGQDFDGVRVENPFR